MVPSRKVRSNLIITFFFLPKKEPWGPKQSLDKELCIFLLRLMQLDFTPKKALRENRSHTREICHLADPGTPEVGGEWIFKMQIGAH